MGELLPLVSEEAREMVIKPPSDEWLREIELPRTELIYVRNCYDCP